MNNKGQPGNNWKETDAEREAEERDISMDEIKD